MRLRLGFALLAAALPLDAQMLTGAFSKVAVHGYLSQAYARSDGNQIFGIPRRGTADYRDVALQLRYDRSRQNVFVVQVRQQRIGDSPMAESLRDVELDWAFYQRNVTDRFSLKAGRIPLPLGIFNEASGAGATFPFYRPPTEFYVRQYTSKTLDGALGSLSLDGPAKWSFDVDGYAGRWKLDRWSGQGGRADARNAWGAQLWANSPIEGVRFGAGAYRCTVQQAGSQPVDYLMVHASADADLDRWRFAAEYLAGKLDFYGRYRAWYGQAGVQLTKRTSVHVRGAVARMNIRYFGVSANAAISDDLGLAVNYALRPGLLFKLEGHTNEGLLREDIPRDLFGATSKTRYFIATVVASF